MLSIVYAQLKLKDDGKIHVGTEYLIEASEDVVIDAGFVVQSGATVIVKSKGKVIITGGDILNGGSLYIEATSVDVTKNFNVADGAKFEVKNNN